MNQKFKLQVTSRSKWKRTIITPTSIESKFVSFDRSSFWVISSFRPRSICHCSIVRNMQITRFSPADYCAGFCVGWSCALGGHLLSGLTGNSGIRRARSSRNLKKCFSIISPESACIIKSKRRVLHFLHFPSVLAFPEATCLAAWKSVTRVRRSPSRASTEVVRTVRRRLVRINSSVIYHRKAAPSRLCHFSGKKLSFNGGLGACNQCTARTNSNKFIK